MNGAARQVALILSYDGARYHGWQIQKHHGTVQSALTEAVRRITGGQETLIGCGRTDAGVHAAVYLASFGTMSRIPAERFPAALNSVLPADIAVRRAYDVPEGFHPLRSARGKEYTYLLYTGRTREPLWFNRALHYPFSLDAGRMQAAARYFEGKHDFAAMRSTGTELSSTVRTVYLCQVEDAPFDAGSFGLWPENSGVGMGFSENVPALSQGHTSASQQGADVPRPGAGRSPAPLSVAGRARRIYIKIRADGFLYNMARAIVGTLLEVGRGSLEADAIPDILKSGERGRAGPTAPAHGLYMTRLWYDSIPELKEIGYER